MARSVSTLSFFALILSGLLLCESLHAQQLNSDQERAAQELFGNVMSPYCVARSLRDCPSTAAHELKDKIRARIAAGENPESIVASLEQTYGDKIRAVPAARGFGLVAWLAPLGFLILGGVVIFTWIRMKGASTAEAPTDAGESLDPETEARIRDELSKL